MLTSHVKLLSTDWMQTEDAKINQLPVTVDDRAREYIAQRARRLHWCKDMFRTWLQRYEKSNQISPRAHPRRRTPARLARGYSWRHWTSGGWKTWLIDTTRNNYMDMSNHVQRARAVLTSLRDPLRGTTLLTRSSAVAERPRAASCLFVVSFNIPTA